MLKEEFQLWWNEVKAHPVESFVIAIVLIVLVNIVCQ